MRLLYTDGYGAEAFGFLFNVSGATVSRWLAKARTSIEAHTRASLLARPGMTDSQADIRLGHVPAPGV